MISVSSHNALTGAMSTDRIPISFTNYIWDFKQCNEEKNP